MRRVRRKSSSVKTQRVKQLPLRRVTNRFTPISILSDDEIEFIHQSSLDVLERVGVDVMSPPGRNILKEAGATIANGSDIVYIDRGLVGECLQTVRPSFQLHARNPAHNLEFGTDQICFATVGSAPHSSDLEFGRRSGNHKDYRNFLRLTQQLNIIHLVGGYPVEPIDLHASIRHLECLRDCVLLTDKVFHLFLF